MRLTIQKRQAEKRGLFGGHKGMLFTIHARAELTPEERSLVDTYKAQDTVLASYTVPSGSKTEPDYELNIDVQKLMQGYQTSEIGDVGTLIVLENDIIKACTYFKKLLNVMETFDGTKTVEFIANEEGMVEPHVVG